jgi:hypothetical protein
MLDEKFRNLAVDLGIVFINGFSRYFRKEIVRRRKEEPNTTTPYNAYPLFSYKLLPREIEEVQAFADAAYDFVTLSSENHTPYNIKGFAGMLGKETALEFLRVNVLVAWSFISVLHNDLRRLLVKRKEREAREQDTSMSGME